MQPTTLYTIGHGRRSTDELVEALRSFGVDSLVDIRAYPGSKANPQFARERMENDLPALGIAYVHRPQLGGRRRGLGPQSPNVAWHNEAFRAYADYMLEDNFWSALDGLLGQAAELATAVMCAETLWWRCHRRLVADAATARGASVIHIMKPHAGQAHKILAPARIIADRVTYAGPQRTA